MSFLEHLEVLRWHIVRSVSALLIFTTAAFFCKSFVFDYLIFPMASADFVTYRAFCSLSRQIGLGDSMCFSDFSFTLINISMAGQFMTHVIVSLVAGIILSFPYILYEAWRFVKPALTRGEKTSVRGIVFWGSFLFISGVLFGYLLIAPLSVQFFGNYTVSDKVLNQINLNSYISTISTVVLACGLVFQLPLMVYFLTRMGILTPRFLRKYRKHALVLNLILAAIITPPDIMSQILVAMPIMLLYEVSIIISAMVLRKSSIVTS